MSMHSAFGATRRARSAVGLLVAAGMPLLGACVPGTGSPGGGDPDSAALTFSQIMCIADHGLDGLSNVRPPTIDEIVRVLDAATDCGFTAPRGYAEEYYEHLTGLAAPRTTTAPSTVPHLEAAQVKCLADRHLGAIAPDRPPTAEEIELVGAVAAGCGLRLI